MMVRLAVFGALAADARAQTWCETNFRGFKTGGDELGAPVEADSWDACTEECAKQERCAWIDWNSDSKDCIVKSGQGGAPQMGNGWICGHCHHAEDPPPPSPQAACKHEGEPCSLTDLCCTAGALTCSLGGASPTAGTCVEVSAGLLHGFGWSYYFSAALLATGLVYVVCGSLLGFAVRGRRGTRALPNHELWAQVGGLVRDGASFTLRGGAQPDTEPLLAKPGPAATTLQAAAVDRSGVLDAMSVSRAEAKRLDQSRQLKSELERLGLSTEGSKTELRERLQAAV